jgi:hypothetical protein
MIRHLEFLTVYLYSGARLCKSALSLEPFDTDTNPCLKQFKHDMTEKIRMYTYTLCMNLSTISNSILCKAYKENSRPKANSKIHIY